MSYQAAQRRRVRREQDRAIAFRRRESKVRAVSRLADRIAGHPIG